ncbi:hypothetical protein NC651_036207 [Populus alba x Populus x berolinensis]|nr:hypothetical protein NC651_036207 [Populus alba x Populus x berolinensis]
MGDKLHRREGNSPDHQLRPLNDCSVIKEVGVQRQPGGGGGGNCPLLPLRGSATDHRALWNPATNELKTLPPLIRKPNLPSLSFYAVFVYSLSNDSWRYWGDLPQNYKLLSNNKCYICLNGVFYWLGSNYSGGKTYDEAIISFDMATDLIQDMQLPDYDKPARETVLSVYHDSLALLTVHDIKDFLELHHQLKLRNRVIPISSHSRSRISGPIQVYSESKAMSEAKSLATELTSC